MQLNTMNGISFYVIKIEVKRQSEVKSMKKKLMNEAVIAYINDQIRIECKH